MGYLSRKRPVAKRVKYTGSLLPWKAAGLQHHMLTPAACTALLSVSPIPTLPPRSLLQRGHEFTMQNSVNHHERGRVKETERDTGREKPPNPAEREKKMRESPPPCSPAPRLWLPTIPPLLSTCDSTTRTHTHAHTHTHAWQMPACLSPVIVAVRAQDQWGKADNRAAITRHGKEVQGLAHPPTLLCLGKMVTTDD